MPTHIEPIVSEPAVSVTPVVETLNNGGTENSSSGSTTENPESGAQQLPLERALKEINAQMQAWSTHLQFSVDKDVNRIVVTVIDAESGDTLRTIPSETLLNVAKMIVNMQGNAVKTAA